MTRDYEPDDDPYDEPDYDPDPMDDYWRYERDPDPLEEWYDDDDLTQGLIYAEEPPEESWYDQDRRSGPWRRGLFGWRWKLAALRWRNRKAGTGPFGDEPPF